MYRADIGNNEGFSTKHPSTQEYRNPLVQRHQLPILRQQHIVRISQLGKILMWGMAFSYFQIHYIVIEILILPNQISLELRYYPLQKSRQGLSS